MNLPTGTVTFLFTDIEGSSRLWEQHPKAMQNALAQHDALLQAAIMENEARLQAVEGLFADPEVARDGERMKRLLRQRAELKAELGNLYEEWEGWG